MSAKGGASPQGLKSLKEAMLILRDELIALLTDHDTYWKIQDVIKNNQRLLTLRSPFFDLFNDSYAYATLIALRRLTERSNRARSLLNVLDELKRTPELVAGLPNGQLDADISRLERIGLDVREYVDKYVAHHDRKRNAIKVTFGQLRSWVDQVEEVFKRYYALLLDTDVDLVVKYLEDPLKIFTFPWIAEPGNHAG